MLFCDRYGPVRNLLILLISTDSHCPGRNFATSSPRRFSLGALEKAPWRRGCQFCKSSVCGKTLGYGMVCTSNVHGADSLLFLLTLLVRFASKLEWLLYLLYDWLYRRFGTSKKRFSAQGKELYIKVTFLAYNVLFFLCVSRRNAPLNSYPFPLHSTPHYATFRFLLYNSQCTILEMSQWMSFPILLNILSHAGISISLLISLCFFGESYLSLYSPN